jgi:hypothetical protein
MTTILRCMAAVLASTGVRRRLALAISPAIAFLGILVAPAVPVEAATFSCHYSFNRSIVVTVPDPGAPSLTLQGEEFAGHYSGNTTVPSTTGVSAAGIEAQCLLVAAGYNPGPIDGIFGPHSQAATRSFQQTLGGFGVQDDGLPGPQTWPWLRCLSAPICNIN